MRGHRLKLRGAFVVETGESEAGEQGCSVTCPRMYGRRSGVGDEGYNTTISTNAWTLEMVKAAGSKGGMQGTVEQCPRMRGRRSKL